MAFKPDSQQTMLAIHIPSYGGPEVLVCAARPVPQPASGNVLIKVQAAGVNRPDMLQRRGLYPPPAGSIRNPGT